MLNRNAARHLLLVVSILLCAFIYAGYSLRTRGDGAQAESVPAASTDAAVTGLRPLGAPPTGADAAVQSIPSARGEDLALALPVASSPRPAPPRPSASSSSPSGVITGLVPAAAPGAAAQPPPSSQSASGTSLPLPGFTAAPAPEAGQSSSPPVLALPGMGAIASADEDDDGDFPALSGTETTAPVLTVPPATTRSAPPPPAASAGTPSRGASLSPPPSASAPATPAPAASTTTPSTGAVLRPPARQNGGMAEKTPSPAPSRTQTPPPPPTTPARPAPATGATTPSRTTPPPPAPRRTPPPPATRPQPADPEPRSDSLRVYVVAPGDTLSSIAARELGSGFLADNIFLLNRDVIDDPNHLLAGVKIRLPYANPAVDAGPAAIANGAAPGRRPTQGLGRTHMVTRGDTLSSIALRYYGSSSRWRFLYEANKTIVPNPNQLTIGTELTIPPYEE